MPKKGYRYPDRNVVCEHCGEVVSALLLDRAAILGQLLETDGPLTADEVCEEMSLSRQTFSTVKKAYRRHYTGLVGKALSCSVGGGVWGGQWVYYLTDKWRDEDGPDIEQNEAWHTKRIGEELITARDMAVVAAHRLDGRKKREKLDLQDFVTTLTSVVDRLQFIRERLALLAEDGHSAA